MLEFKLNSCVTIWYSLYYIIIITVIIFIYIINDLVLFILK